MRAIWAKDSFQQNTELCFYIKIGRYENASLKIVAKDVYNLYINGNFVAYGPARAAKGYYSFFSNYTQKLMFSV